MDQSPFGKEKKVIRHRKAWLTVVCCLMGLLIWGSCGVSDSSGRKVLVSYGTFDQLPRTDAEARTAGWTELTDIAVDLELGGAGCVPNHGRHFVFVKGEAQEGAQRQLTWARKVIDPVTVLMNKEGILVAMELSSLTEQASPPWESSPNGHPDMPYKHWHLHIYFQDPATVC